jgi:hypothetical protein
MVGVELRDRRNVRDRRRALPTVAQQDQDFVDASLAVGEVRADVKQVLRVKTYVAGVLHHSDPIGMTTARKAWAAQTRRTPSENAKHPQGADQNLRGNRASAGQALTS